MCNHNMQAQHAHHGAQHPRSSWQQRPSAILDSIIVMSKLTGTKDCKIASLVPAELRAGCNLERKANKAPPPRLTSTQRKLVEQLQQKHGNDVQVCSPLYLQSTSFCLWYAFRLLHLNHCLYLSSQEEVSVLVHFWCFSPSALEDNSQPAQIGSRIGALFCSFLMLSKELLRSGYPKCFFVYHDGCALQAMVLDTKLNKMQHSAGHLKKLIAGW